MTPTVAAEPSSEEDEGLEVSPDPDPADSDEESEFQSAEEGEEEEEGAEISPPRRQTRSRGPVQDVPRVMDHPIERRVRSDKGKPRTT